MLRFYHNLKKSSGYLNKQIKCFSSISIDTERPLDIKRTKNLQDFKQYLLEENFESGKT